MNQSDLRLELLSEAHLGDFEAIVDDPEIARFTRFPSPTPVNFVVDWYARYLAGRADGTREAFAAMTGDRQFVGLALAPQIDQEGRELELGYLVAPAARGRGVATEMLRQLTSWAFDAAGALRASLIIDVDNLASRRVAERAGYLREGTLRSTYFKQGLRSDVEIWGRLPSDPPPP